MGSKSESLLQVQEQNGQIQYFDQRQWAQGDNRQQVQSHHRQYNHYHDQQQAQHQCVHESRDIYLEQINQQRKPRQGNLQLQKRNNYSRKDQMTNT